MKFVHLFLKDRFALGAGLYIGSWGIHFYLDLGPFCLGIEIAPKQRGDQ